MGHYEYEEAIDGGTVSYEDGAKAAEEYAPARKVRVELNWSVPEGTSNSLEILERVADAARNQVHRLLGASPAVLATVAGQPAANAAAPAATRTRRTKAQIEADKAAAGNADPAAVSEDPTAGEEHVVHLPDQSNGGSAGGAQTSGDGADMSEFDVEPEGNGADMSEFDVAPEPAKEITDADLNSAVQKRNGELGAPQLIRDLIGSYNPDKSKPFQLRQIPAAERAGFMSKLAGLQKPAA